MTHVDRHPFHGGERCYACDAKPLGLRDRRPEGGDLEVGCDRHADPTILVYPACIYCNGTIRKGSVRIDGQFAHKSCHQMVERDTFDRTMNERCEARAALLRARAKRSKPTT